MQTLSIVHPASVRSLKDDLYSSTALTPPTHHKGGGFGKILGIVAAIAIPYAAPAIATAIGASGAIGSALVGAGLGAVAGLATGQNPLLGAAIGGIGGYMGYSPTAGTGAAQAMSGPEMGAGAGEAFTGVDTFSSAFPTPTMGPAGVTSAMPGDGLGFAPSLEGSGQAMTGGAGFGPHYPTLEGTGAGAAPNLGAQLSGGGSLSPFDPAISGVGGGSLSPFDPVLQAGGGGGSLSPFDPAISGVGPPTGIVNPNAPPPGSQFVMSPNAAGPGQPALFNNMRPYDNTIRLDNTLSGGSGNDWSIGAGAGDNLSGAGAMPANYRRPPLTGTSSTGLTTPASASAQPSLGASLSNLGESLPGFLKGDMAKQVGAKLVTQGLGNLFAEEGPVMSPMEEARLADLQRMRGLQEAAAIRQQGIADTYLQQAQAINPEVYGRQALADQQNRYARADAARMRGLTGAQRTAAQRRSSLDRARLPGYGAGLQRGQTMRDQYMTAARGAAPNYAGLTTNYSNDLTNAGRFYDRGQQEKKNIAGVFDPIVQAGIFGRTDKELADRDKEIDTRAKGIGN